MENIKTIHFIGIRGVGMTALALYAKERGFEISGSDVNESFVTDEMLSRSGINVTEFDEKNINNKPDLIVVSAAYGKDNPEVKAAKKKHLEIKTYSETLAFFSHQSQLIAVSGIHGKTTTTAIISFLLAKANFDPSFIIGAGSVSSLGATGHAGKGDYFVSEADEYRKSPEDNTPKFFDLCPKIIIITSIEMDHPDVFSSEENIYSVFYKFACRIPRSGFIVLNTDYPKAKKLQRSLVDRNIESYGFGEASWQIVDLRDDSQETSFSLKNQDKIFGPFKLKIPGRANILNAAAAIITCLKIGVGQNVIQKYLPEFSGVKRRFEIIGKIGETVLIDDYAHHPRAIALTLEAARNKFPDYKIWCIFQPHTYSRTQKLLADFALSFKKADKVIITDIYSSARENQAIISGLDLANAIRVNQRNVRYIENKTNIISEIIDNLQGKNVVLTCGAGDIYKINYEIKKMLKNEDKKNQ